MVLPAIMLGAAVGDTTLTPGLWEIRNTPGVATLDGQVLDDLPLGEIRTQKLCLAAADVADPAAFFARDTQADCRITTVAADGDRIDIVGVCPNPDEGVEGALKLSGRYGPDSYELDFSTRAEDFQGVMTFSGRLTGRRVGSCPAN